jgi:hypothetical protein
MMASAIDANGRTKLQCPGSDYADTKVVPALTRPLAK